MDRRHEARYLEQNTSERQNVCVYRIPCIMYRVMYLKRLEIQGFKSFAHKTVLEFLPPTGGLFSITALVGPNGAGKSNVVDALRWVMGETSLKNIRGKKSEDVIFHGSDQRSAVGVAEVVMVLDNTSLSVGAKGLPPLQADIENIHELPEITVTRRFYRSGEGEYLINGQPVRLLDIQLLLAKLHFAQQAYSIISQGMIDRLLTVSPAERKDFFDEACGIKEYQIKEHQARLKLARTEDNMRQAEALLTEVEPRLRLLSRQVKKLEKRQEVEVRLREAQEQYYSALYFRNQEEADKSRARQRGVDAEYRAAFGELETVQKELGGLARGASRQELFARLQERHRAARDAEHELERRLAVLEGQLRTTYTERGEHQVGWLNSKVGELDQKLKKLTGERECLEATLQAAEQELAAEAAKIETRQRAYAELQLRLSERPSQTADSRAGALVQIAGREALVAFGEARRRFGTVAYLLVSLDSGTCSTQLFGRDRELAEILIAFQKVPAITFPAEVVVPGERGEEPGQETRLQAVEMEQELSAARARQLSAQVRREGAERDLKARRIDERALEHELAQLRQELRLAEASPEAFSAELKQLAQEKNKLLKQLSASVAEAASITKEVGSFNSAEEEKKQRIFSLQDALQKKQRAVDETVRARNEINIELAKIETRQEDLVVEVQHEIKLSLEMIVKRLAGSEARSPAMVSELADTIDKLKYQLSLIGGIDEEVVQEYATTKERYDFLTGQLTDLRAATNDLQEMIAELDELMKKKRAAAFKRIKKEFDRYFRILFDGGQADLEEVYGEDTEGLEGEGGQGGTEDPSLRRARLRPEGWALPGGEVLANTPPDPSQEGSPTRQARREKILTGIDVIASPPGKKVKYLNMLSGGERTLTSIALICAILHNNPSPFVVLDEVEAALDEANTLRFAKIMAELAVQSQFIIVTHNRVTMHAAHALYGVVIGPDGASKLLSVKLEEAEKYEDESSIDTRA